MLRFLRYLILFAVPLLTAFSTFGQTFSVQIYVEKAYFSGYIGDEYGPRIRLYKTEWRDEYGYALWYNANCIKLPNVQTGMLDVNRTYNTTVTGHTFDLIVVTHEERKSSSDDCTVQGISDVSTRKPDRFQASVTQTIDLNNYPPGQYSPAFTMQTLSDGTQVITYLKIRYQPVKLTAPAGNQDANCSTSPYTLSTGNDPSYSATNTTGLNYVWEYNIVGTTDSNPDYNSCINDCFTDFNECNQTGGGRGGENCGTRYSQCRTGCASTYPPTIDKWVTLETTSSNVYTFDPLAKIFAGSLTSSKSVRFRVRAKGPELEGPTSAVTGSYTFLPPAPNAPEAGMTADPSCPDINNTLSGTGVVYVTGVTSLFSPYRYILKYGDVPNAQCDPAIEDDCLRPGSHSGTATGATFQIGNVAPGPHTLFLLNNGGTQGFCPRRIGVINVPVIPNLVLNQNPVVPQNITCYGANNGSISLSISGGRPANVIYTATNTTLQIATPGITNTANAAITLNGLQPGNYHLTVEDNCTPKQERDFIVTQSVKVLKANANDFQKGDATCSDPGNGTARIIVQRSSGAFDRSVSTTLSYQLFKGTTPYRYAESSELTYTWTSLPPGQDYKILVKEKDGLDCNGYEESFVINGPPIIGMTGLQTTDVSCFGGNNGAISVRGTGRTTYIYQITNADGNALSNATGDFSALTAGGYKLVITSTATCDDNYTRTDSIRVEQPYLLTASITKTDISCNTLTDGKITSTITGGTEGTGYTYIWETFIDGTNPQWVAMSNQGAILPGRSAGDYRLRVKDVMLCETLSNEVTIIEPAPLVMSSATLSDIVCLGGKGKIIPTVSGGTTPYSFYYSTNNWSTSTLFTTSSLLDASTYQVKVKDKNGCEYPFADNLVITDPPSVVSFTQQLSDFNGFNISCYGGSNGSAVITAIGGNGGSYSGYTYTVDNGTYQTNPTLENIAAGTRTLHVKDARGCIVSKTIPFTQTAALLAAEVVNKQDLVCFDGATGFIEITGTGGNAPFQYSLDGGTFADAGKFTQLKKGIYNITVKDRNNCISASPYELISLHPELIIQTRITDVSCFDGKDGAVATTVVGGVSPYQYQWKEVNSTSANINTLSVGTYTLTVTDQVSCTMKTTATVQQPLQPLKIRLATVPVCYDRPNGSITATVNGGTAPYQYSIDNGVTYQQEIAFSKGAGNYVITSRDSKGCIITSSTTIEVRNTMPEPNFLVASARNALDTLAIIDISVPKPDSIHWTFDPQAIIIKDDPWTPELRFTEAGTYQVKMTGFFAGCDYSVTKKMTLSPYDANALKETLPGYKPIESMTVTPNPSNGEFELRIKLTKKYKLSLVIFDVLGVRHYNKNWSDIDELDEQISLTDVPAGVYMLRAITESDAQDIRIVINK